MQTDDVTREQLDEIFGLSPEERAAHAERSRALLDAAAEIIPETPRADLPRPSQPPGQ